MILSIILVYEGAWCAPLGMVSTYLSTCTWGGGVIPLLVFSSTNSTVTNQIDLSVVLQSTNLLALFSLEPWVMILCPGQIYDYLCNSQNNNPPSQFTKSILI